MTANTTSFSDTGLGCDKAFFYRVRAHRNGDDSYSEYSDTASASTLACAPEMDVRSGDGSVPIASGDLTPTSADGTDFGTAHVDNIKVAHSFTIYNTGTVALQLTGKPIVAISGAAAADFSVTKQPADHVGAGKYVAFTITFDPTAAGARAAVVSIANDDSDENPYTFSVQGQGNATYYNLTAAKTGTGTGSVVSIPSGIDCGPDCTASFAEGSTVKLTAVPELGSQFAGWSGGGCSGLNDCEVTMAANTTVTAAFDTGSDQTPAQIVLTAPGNDAYINTPSFNFSWEADPDAAVYRIQVSRNSSFTKLAVNEVVNGTTFSGGSLTDKRYYWRVRGTNAYNDQRPVERGIHVHARPGSAAHAALEPPAQQCVRVVHHAEVRLVARGRGARIYPASGDRRRLHGCGAGASDDAELLCDARGQPAGVRRVLLAGAGGRRDREQLGLERGVMVHGEPDAKPGDEQLHAG